MTPSDNNRKLGLLFAAVFVVLALYPAWGPGLTFSGRSVRIWSLAVATGFLLVAWLRPSALSLLTRAWLSLGTVLHHIVNPLILGVLFFLVITPTGLLRRWFGGGEIALRYDAARSSYWIDRQPPGPDPKTLPRQF